MPLKRRVKKMRGLTKRCSDTPADFAAANSQFSPKLPKAIIDDSKTAIGNAWGMMLRVVQYKNFRIKVMLIPLPAMLSNVCQSNCITKTNRTIKKVARKGTKNVFKMYLSKIFIVTKVVS